MVQVTKLFEPRQKVLATGSWLVTAKGLHLAKISWRGQIDYSLGFSVPNGLIEGDVIIKGFLIQIHQDSFPMKFELSTATSWTPWVLIV